MPNCAFVNEKDEIELPKLEIYYINVKKQDILFLTGDLQPIDERSCYELCHSLLEFFKEIKVSEVITLGGLGLEDVPKNPKVYCSGTDKKIISKYCTKEVLKGTDGVFGPIVGVAGVLIGLAREFEIPGIILLVETSSHPSLLGIKSAQQLISILKSHLKLTVDTKKLEKEIVEIETELKGKLKKQIVNEKIKPHKEESMNYIG
jgi:proteasome assembly chaperone (PAC2) family protein